MKTKKSKKTSKRSAPKPVVGGVFTDEDYAYLGRVVADAYTHALRRRAAEALKQTPNDRISDGEESTK